MKTHFILRSEKVSKKTGLCPILIRVSHDNIVVRKMVPAVRVEKSDWNKNNYSVLPPKGNEPYNYYKEYNILLGDIKYRLNELYRKSLLGKTITKDEIVKAIDSVSENSSNRGERDLLDVFKEFIEKSRINKAERTITGYTTTFNTLKSYFDSIKTNPTFDILDLRFYEEFKNYCFNEKGFKDNYFAKLIAHIKTFMNWSLEREYHNSVSFINFKAPKHDAEIVFLDQQELKALYHHNFKSEKLARARDLFCFSCFTGLRYAELENLKPSNIVNGNLNISVKSQKNIELNIPLNKYALEILDKYKRTVFKPLPIISSQKLNNYIKEVCKEAEINTMVKVSRNSGEKVMEEFVPKHELTSIETGRNTFVVISLMLEIPTGVIKEVTGYRTDRVFDKYFQAVEGMKKNEV